MDELGALREVAKKLQAERDAAVARAEKLGAALEDEAYHHAACLSIAEGAPGWETFEHKRPASKAVADLRARMETAEAELARWTGERRMPCGCVKCVCPEDDDACHGCGAREAEACQRSRLAGGPRHVEAGDPTRWFAPAPPATTNATTNDDARRE